MTFRTDVPRRNARPGHVSGPEPSSEPSPPGARLVQVPFTTLTDCRALPPERTQGPGRPPLLVALHGQGQSGARHARWMGGAVPPGFAAAFPDGFHAHEVRKPDRKARLGHGWYLFTGDQQAFADSLARSEEAFWRLVETLHVELGTDPGRLYLTGFSQGCYLTHILAVRSARHGPGPVAGWIGQSGRLKDEFLGEQLAAVAGRPVLLQHGRDDPATPMEFAERSARALERHGAQVELRLYDAGHVITREMVGDARAWLEAREPGA